MPKTQRRPGCCVLPEGTKLTLAHDDHGVAAAAPRYVVAADGVARIGGDAVVACHPMPYPYEVYYCHRPADAVALRVDLHAVAGVGLGGATAVDVCHVNTTTWDSAYFELLKASRGDAICHYMPQGYVLWLAN
ncbi:hypothetical protein OsJ_06306 [Oryza sativa Japonica Group]|uniref:BURP domain-containing protein n=1 Tax=Oryza sativa subsp. japonica TaxID=39947 RepID=B9F529_ORYSJ|nr:hypothetical protein OsJ_06306 [Oryza sativa Japonica Group]